MITDEHIVIFGEVLFDCFEDGSQILGGAPFNVAWNLKALGAHPLLISKVGDDELGKQILEAMNTWGLSTDGMQIDENHGTGTVQIHITNGEPSFEIPHPMAFDFISEHHLPYLPLTGIVYHGSLALRHDIAQQALAKLLEQMEAKIFIDINLRQPWWDDAQVKALVSSTNWLKLNQDELALLTSGDNDPQRIAQLFGDAENLKELILTQGEQGAMSITQEGELNRIEPKKDPNIIDTVGAGDAFSSVVILGKHLSWANDLTLARAQDFASGVVGLQGATTSDPSFYQAFKDQWQE